MTKNWMSSWMGHLSCQAALLCAGCQPNVTVHHSPNAPGFSDPEISISPDMPTVAQVTWRTEGEAGGWVQVRDALGVVLETPLEVVDGIALSAQLRGLRANTKYTATVHAAAKGENHTGPEVTFTTGHLSNDAPTLAVEGNADPGFHLLPVLNGERSGSVMITDMDGIPVWGKPTPDRWSTRARFSMDGQAILLMHFSTEMRHDPRITRFAFDGRVDHEIDIPTGHHDFVEVAEGRYRFLGQHTIELEGTEILVDTVEEIEVGGEAEIIFDFGEALSPHLDLLRERPDEGMPVTHVNAINIDPETDRAVFSDYNMRAIYMVDLSTGSLLWILNEHDVDLALTQPEDGSRTPWGGSHEVRFTDRGIAAFFNDSGVSSCSYGADIEIDEDTRVAHLEVMYQPEPCISVFTLGGIVERANGNWVLSLTSAGQIDEFTPEGELLHRLNTELGTAIGYGERVDSLYP